MSRYAVAWAVVVALCVAIGQAAGAEKKQSTQADAEKALGAATGEIAKCAAGSDKMLCGAAISALGKIGSADAATALDKTLASAPDDQKTLVYDALLKAAEKMMSKGDRPGALKIYRNLNKEGVPQLVRTAALKGMVNAAGRGETK